MNKSWVAGYLLVLAIDSQANNLYVDGSQSHTVVQSVSHYLPFDMAVIVSSEDKPLDYVESLKKDHALYPLALDLISEAWSQPLSTARAYAQVIERPVEGKTASFCVIRAKTEADLRRIALHEALHCQVNHLDNWKRFAEYARPLIKAEDVFGRPAGSEVLRQYVLEEAHARVLGFVLSSNLGEKGDSHYLNNRLSKDYPDNPGSRSILSGIDICREDLCPTDGVQLMRKLSTSARFREAFERDINHIKSIIDKSSPLAG